MIEPHKRTPVFSEWKEKARRLYKLDIRSDRPFSVWKGEKELRVNTSHSVIIAYDGSKVSVWNKPLQCAGKKLSVDELIAYRELLTRVWLEIEGDVE